METENKPGFYFNEKSHRYYFDGVPMVGVTTVVGCLNKPALIPWAANIAIDYIYESIGGKPGRATQWVIPDDVLELARQAHARKRDLGAEKGKDTHSYLEAIIKCAIEETNGYIPTVVSFPDKQVEQFCQWANKNNVQFLVSEKRMFSKAQMLGGTADFTCIIDGKKYVGDIKTFNRIYDMSPFLQTAGYRFMLEEMGERGFFGSVIIMLGKDGSFGEFFRMDEQGEDVKIFLSLLEVYRAITLFKNSL